MWSCPGERRECHEAAQLVAEAEPEAESDPQSAGGGGAGVPDLGTPGICSAHPGPGSAVEGGDLWPVRSGDTFGAVTEFRDGWLAYAVGEAEFVEPIGPIAFFVEDISLAGPPEAVYAWTDLPEAVRAVCALRLRANVGVYPISAEDDFNWDETYTMEAVPNANGVYRFPLELKYTDGGKQEEAEQSTLRLFSRRIRRGPTVDFDCDVTVTFYDEQGEVVHTYEEALAEARYHTKPIV